MSHQKFNLLVCGIKDSAKCFKSNIRLAKDMSVTTTRVVFLDWIYHLVDLHDCYRVGKFSAIAIIPFLFLRTISYRFPLFFSREQTVHI